MRRIVTILYRGEALRRIPVELDSEDETEFVARAVRQALQLGAFDRRRLKDITFKVEPATDGDESPILN